MANVKISDLTTSLATLPSTGVLFEVEDLTGGDVSKKMDSSVIAEFIRDTIGACLVAGSNITITVNDAGDTIQIDAAGGGAGLWTHPGVISGRKYPMDAYSRASGALTINGLSCLPFRAPKTGNLVGLAARVVTGAASAHIQAGIYANNAGAPASSGALAQVVLDASTSGSTPYTAFGTPLAVTAGTVYWMVCNNDVSVTVIGTSSGDAVIPWLLGYDESSITAGGGITSVGTTGGGYTYATGLPTGAFPAMIERTNVMPIIDLVYA